MDDEELDAITERVLTAVGRNLLIYQYIEQQLKSLAHLSEITFDLNDPAAAHRKRQAELSRKTLGQVSRTWLSEILTTATSEEIWELEQMRQIDTTRPVAIVNFTISLESDDLASRQRNLELVVAQRNALVHHFWIEFSFATVADCQLTLDTLRAQRREAIAVSDDLDHALTTIEHLPVALRAWMAQHAATASEQKPMSPPAATEL